MQVSSIREPLFVRLSRKVAARSGPPLLGFQCSVSSATMKLASAPSAAVVEDVMISSVPSGALKYFVLPGSRPNSTAIREPLGAKARTMRIVFAVWLSAVAAI